MLKKIRSDIPGQRFLHVHERHRFSNPLLRIGAILAGFLLITGGAVTFWLPGPNFVLVLGGLALVAAQWRLAARFLDWLEVAGRRVKGALWDPRSKGAKRVIALILWLVFAAGCAAAVLGLWHAGLLPASFTDRIPEWVPLTPE